VPRNADLALLDAIDQADLVRRGEVTATELVETAISRIELLNPALSAVIFTSYEEALARGGKPTRRVAWEELHIC
jgi:amidase